MRAFAIIAVLLTMFFTSVAQSEPVTVVFDQATVHQGDSLHFTIYSNITEPLEVMVLSNEFLGLQQNVQIAYSSMPFHIATADFPVGKYFILVTANGVHIEKEFSISKP